MVKKDCNNNNNNINSLFINDKTLLKFLVPNLIRILTDFTK